MRTTGIFALGVLALLGGSLATAQAGGHWSVGISLGAPLFYRPWCPYYASYRPYPIYVDGPPVVYQAVPVYQPVPVAQPVYAAPVSQAPAPAPATQAAAPAQPAPVAQASLPLAPIPVTTTRQPEVEQLLQHLSDSDERVRGEAAMQLGRLKAQKAVDPLAATLAGDPSPKVRESAARALGLIGSPKGLTVLQRAALADNDYDVRHSAQFAAEVVQSGSGR
jgi:hypothetical protein